jgi:uncharacterized protein (DUF2267 family)
MQLSGADTLNSAVEKALLWLTDLMHEGGLVSEAQAYTVLRAVVHTLRDRLTVDDAAHLGAQMPMLIRGMYYEGWKPARLPIKTRALQEFLADVDARLGSSPMDPESCCRAVFSFLADRVSAGEVEDVRHMLPEEVRELWPAPGRRI